MGKLSTDWNDRLKNSSYDLEDCWISASSIKQAGYHSRVQFCILNIYLGNTRNLLLKTKHFS